MKLFAGTTVYGGRSPNVVNSAVDGVTRPNGPRAARRAPWCVGRASVDLPP